MAVIVVYNLNPVAFDPLIGPGSDLSKSDQLQTLQTLNPLQNPVRNNVWLSDQSNMMSDQKVPTSGESDHFTMMSGHTKHCTSNIHELVHGVPRAFSNRIPEIVTSTLTETLTPTLPGFMRPSSPEVVPRDAHTQAHRHAPQNLTKRMPAHQGNTVTNRISGQSKPWTVQELSSCHSNLNNMPLDLSSLPKTTSPAITRALCNGYVPIKRKAESPGCNSTGSGCSSSTGNCGSGSPGSEPPAKKKSNRGRKPGQLSKGNHLWEFLLELLRDERYSPGLIKWENRSLGVFRIVKSHDVARMWGERKNRPTMNYEKLSRALRFCKTVGYIADVPKDGPYPKKLCFSFGKNTSGWEEPNNMPYNKFNQQAKVFHKIKQEQI